MFEVRDARAVGRDARMREPAAGFDERCADWQLEPELVARGAHDREASVGHEVGFLNVAGERSKRAARERCDGEIARCALMVREAPTDAECELALCGDREDVGGRGIERPG